MVPTLQKTGFVFHLLVQIPMQTPSSQAPAPGVYPKISHLGKKYRELADMVLVATANGS